MQEVPEEDYDFYFEEDEAELASQMDQNRAYGISRKTHSHSRGRYYQYYSTSKQQHGTTNCQQSPIISNFRKRHPLFLIPNFSDWKSNSGLSCHY